MKNYSKTSLELGKRFPLRKVFAQILTMLILWQTIIPASFAFNGRNNDDFLLAKKLLASSVNDATANGSNDANEQQNNQPKNNTSDTAKSIALKETSNVNNSKSGKKNYRGNKPTNPLDDKFVHNYTNQSITVNPNNLSNFSSPSNITNPNPNQIGISNVVTNHNSNNNRLNTIGNINSVTSNNFINKNDSNNNSTNNKLTPLLTSLQDVGEVAVVKHSPGLNGGRAEGHVRVLLGEGLNLNSGMIVTGDLLLPGTPNININGTPTYNGTIVGTGNSSPSGYGINLNSGVSLRHIVTRTDAITINNVSPPAQSNGNRNVALNPGQDPGDFATIRDLTLNSNYGSLSVPPGNYNNLTANSGTSFIFGIEGQNTTYNIQGLALNSNSQVQILGTVELNLNSVFNLGSPSTIGSAASPISLILNIANGGLNLNSNTNIYGAVRLPQGTANINSGSVIQGQLICDRFNLNGGTLKGFVADTSLPTITIQSPSNNAVIVQSTVTVTGTFDDDSVVNLVKVNGVIASITNNSYSATIPLTLGSNTITAVATDFFGNNGQTSITVTRSDGTNLSPVVNAGGDQTIILPSNATLNGNVTDDGLPQPANLMISWSKVSGVGDVTFTQANQASTTASFSTAGTYVLRLTANDGALSASDDIQITVNPAQAQNTAPTVNAGNDQTITLPSTASLTATATDDGLPSPPAQLTYSWTKISGSGTVTFGNSTSLSTTATFSDAGSYTLRFTANDSALSANDDVVITVNPSTPQNTAPVVNAGADQTITLPSNVTLQGSITDDGLPQGANLSITWTKVSGTGNVTFSSPNTAITQATFSQAGTYILRLNASDTELTGTDEVEIIVNSPANQAPTVNAGTDQSITLPASANLVGTANDDELPNPPATLTYTWAKVSSAGNVTFSQPNQLTTTASFSAAGSYVLRLTASDSELFSSDDIAITVIAQNQAPTVNVGADQTITLPSNANLIATASDDGLPSPPATLTYSWSKLSGEGTVTFSQPNQLSTSASFSVAGTYVLRITVSDSALSATDDVQIIVNPAPPQNQIPTVSAGTDQTITLPSSANLVATASDDGIPNPPGQVTFVWSKVSGSGNVTFSQPNQLSTSASFSIAGVYILRITANDSELSASDDITVTVNAAVNQAPVVNAGQAQNLVVPYGPNLIVNPGNEGQIINSLPQGWSLIFGDIRWSKPQASTPPYPASVEGSSVFLNENGSGQIYQDIDVSNYSTAIDSGNQKFVFNGYLRGNGANTSSSITVTYFNSTGGGLTSYSTPNVSSSDWLFFTDIRTAPVGTRRIRVYIFSNNAYADALSLRALLNTQNLPSTTLTATVTDDGLPQPSQITLNWSKLSGVGAVSFTSPTQLSTTASFSNVGSYVLRLTATDGVLTSFDDITVVVSNITNTNDVTVNAGTDQTLVVPYGPNLIKNPSNEGQIINNVPEDWKVIFGDLNWRKPQSGTPPHPSAIDGTTTFYNENGSGGLYQDIDVSSYSTSIDAGSQKFVFNAFLRSYVVNLTEARVTVAYFNSTGNTLGFFEASFSTNSIANSEWKLFTDLRNAPVGTRRIRVEMYSRNSYLDAFSLRALLGTQNLASTNLTGLVLENSNPIDDRLYIQWTMVSGPGAVTFSSPYTVNTSASFSDLGTYVLRLTASDLAFSLSDEVTVTLKNIDNVNNVTISAGADQTVTAAYGPNLVINPSNEAAIVSNIPSGWTYQFGATNWSQPTSPTPIDGATSFFNTGGGIYQDIDLSPYSQYIDSGNQKLVFSYYIRGNGSGSSVRIITEYRNSGGGSLFSFDTGNLSPADWTLFTEIRTLPVGTRLVRIYLQSFNAFADSLSVRVLLNTTSLPSVNLTGVVLENGNPVDNRLYIQWSKVSGRGNVTFSNPNSLNTTASFTDVGTYVLRLTARDLNFSISDDIVITLNETQGQNQAPVVSAGEDKIIGQDTTSLTATATDDGLPNPPGQLTITWSKVNGSGNVTFSNSSSATTNVTFSQPGVYTLRITVTDSQLTTFDDVVISYITNFAPVVNVGADQSTTLNSPITVSGSYTDDGRPANATYTFNWSLVANSGPGPVTFSNPNSLNTTARFPFPGTYTLRLSVSDGNLTGQDDLIVIVTPDNQPPLVSAGANQQITTLSTTLSGTVIDDGLPTAVTITQVWSQVSGQSGVSFSNPTSTTTTATFPGLGTYTLRLTATDTALSFSNDVTIEVLSSTYSDLVINQINTPSIVLDGQSLSISGQISANISNVGNLPTSSFIVTFFEDLNNNRLFDTTDNVLATATNQGLAANSSATISANVSGNVQFSNSVIFAYVDSGQTTAESNENNNYFTTEPACEYIPVTNLYPPSLKFAWNNTNSNTPAQNSVLMAPVVVDLNADGYPDIIFASTFFASLPGVQAVITAISGKDGSQLFVLSNINHVIPWGSPITVGDIDNDGRPEIIAINNSGNRLIAFEHDGTFKWLSPLFNGAQGGGGYSPSIADLDGDGIPEIIMGCQVFNNDGTTRWVGSNPAGLMSTVADLDGDGIPEILASNTVYRANGTVFWQKPGFCITQHAVANFDNDPFPEILAFCSSGVLAQISLLKYDGTIIWGPISGDFVGSPTVADLDGDGELEIGISGSSHYTVIETNGTIKWSIPTQDFSSAITSSTSFDFDGDGKAEILYCDEIKLRIINGTDGSILFELPLSSGTLREHPLVADVDNDGSADLIVPVDGGIAGNPPGVYVYHNPSRWVGARKIFNQHNYRIPNINDDSTIPRKLQPPLPKYNGHRYQKLTSGCEYSRPELAASFVRKSTVGNNVEVTVRLGNGGRALAKSGVVVALYDGNPSSGGNKLTTITTSTDLLANSFIDLVATLSNTVVANTLCILVDETNLVFETDENNNTYNSGLTLGVNNLAPVVNAGDDQTITSLTTNLSATISDDGLPSGTLSINWGKVSGAGTVTFANPTQANTGVTFSQGGTYLLRVSAFDGELTTSDEIQINVLVNTAPVVNVGADQTITTLTTTLNGSVTDDNLPTPPTLQPTWSKVSGAGTVTFTSANSLQTDVSFSGGGTYVLRFSVSDTALTGTDDIEIIVNAALPTPPTVVIHSPLDGATITKPTDIVATISNGNWVLEYSLNPDDDLDPTRTYTTIAIGNTTVTNSTIATLDPTLLLNGNYLVRLRVTDDFGQIVIFPISTVLDKNLKVGNFTLSFTDSAVPVAGIPITVIRTYDSRDKRKGDFGVGWTLDVKNIRLEKSSNLGKHWLETLDQEGFTFRYRLVSTRSKFVTITFPDGKVFKFKAKPNPDSQIAAISNLNSMDYVPEPGTFGTLVALEQQDLRVEGNAPQVPPSAEPVQIINLSGPNPGLPFNPKVFKLTTLEGAEFIIDETSGLQSITDLNGNTLTVNNNGLVHSSGKSITFTRDAQGRISQITDPNGHSQTYSYNSAGDLVSHTDTENNTTSFTYNNDHYLLDITDPRGIKPIRNEYDSDGRLIKHTDAFNREIIYTHQIAAKTETITDRLGNPTVFEYDDNGNVLKQTDALGHITTYAYDNFDNQLTETNAINKTTTSTYDGVDNLLTQTDALGNTTTYTYNGRRQALTITDPKGNITTNTYDGKGNLSTSKDALNHITIYTYNTQGLVLTQTDAQNNVTTYQYGGSQPSQITDAQGHISSLTYDQNGNLLTSTTTRTVDSVTETLTTTNTYDNLNRLTQVTYSDNSSTSTTYNAIGKPATSTDQLGRVTSYSYDSMGQLTSTTFADLTTTSSTYDAEGRRLTSTDQLGQVSSLQYDVLGRLTKTTAPDNSFTTIVYDAIGRVSSTNDQLGHTTIYEYDPNCGCSGRRSKITDALNNITTFAYDQNGNKSSFTDARGNTTSYTYDQLNRQIRVTFPDSTFTETAYDSLGRRTSVTNQAGKTTQFFYDSLGRLIKVKDALNHETLYGYDELGQQITQTDAKNRTTSYQYDKLGRRVKRTLPMGQFETYQYDLAGRLTSRRDFNNKLTTFTYDQLNRLLSKIPDASFGQTSITFTYNNLGQRLTIADSSGTSTYSYDNRNRLTSKATPQGTLTYTYNTVGNITTLRSSNTEGVSLDYAYDNLNRLQTVTDNNLPTSQNQTGYQYDQIGNLQSVTLPNQVATTYQYNTLNRLTNVNAAKTGTTIASYTYTLGASGNRLSVSELSGRVVNYTYDSIYRLTNETISGNSNPVLNGFVDYSYDEVGNRLSRTSTLAAVPSQQNIQADNNDRLTTDSYDDNGSTVAADGRVYTYDFENHVISVTGNGATISIKYDGDGNRVEKSVTQNGQTVVTKYLVDTNNLTGYAQVVEEIQTNFVSRQYSYGLDLISQRQLIGNDRISSFYGTDGLGSTRFLTDSNGNTTDSWDFDGFGILVSQTGNTPNNYLYAGEQFDFDLNLYYNRARYLEVNRGRFWTQDAFEGITTEATSLHKYTYSNNDPINKIDPSGHYGQDTLAVAFIVALTLTVIAGHLIKGLSTNFGGPLTINRIEGEHCEIQVRLSTTAVIGVHAYILTRNSKEQESHYFRAGPNGANKVFAIHGIYRPYTKDYETNNAARVVYNILGTCEQVNKSFTDTTLRVSYGNISYNPFTTNSNRFVYTALSRAGLPADYIGQLASSKLTPTISVFPGWGEELELDEKIYIPNFNFNEGFGENEAPLP
jgi:RHS repeat-associated protein